MNPAFFWKLGFHIRKTNIGTQKIDSSTFETFRIVIADFQIKDKGDRLRFFQKTFLVADTKFKVILRMPFLKISNANVAFGEGTLTWKSYTTNEALLITEKFHLVDAKKFVIVALHAYYVYGHPEVERNGYEPWQEVSD